MVSGNDPKGDLGHHRAWVIGHDRAWGIGHDPRRAGLDRFLVVFSHSYVVFAHFFFVLPFNPPIYHFSSL